MPGVFIWWNTVFILTDAHAQIDAQPPSSASFLHREMSEIDDFLSKMHGSMMNSPYICRYSILWWCIWSQIVSLSFCTNTMFCSRPVGFYLNEYGMVYTFLSENRVMNWPQKGEWSYGLLLLGDWNNEFARERNFEILHWRDRISHFLRTLCTYYAKYFANDWCFLWSSWV